MTHSPRHAPQETPFSTIQGSSPCCNWKITFGLEKRIPVGKQEQENESMAQTWAATVAYRSHPKVSGPDGQSKEGEKCGLRGAPRGWLGSVSGKSRSSGCALLSWNSWETQGNKVQRSGDRRWTERVSASSSSKLGPLQQMRAIASATLQAPYLVVDCTWPRPPTSHLERVPRCSPAASASQGRILTQWH